MTYKEEGKLYFVPDNQIGDWIFEYVKAKRTPRIAVSGMHDYVVAVTDFIKKLGLEPAKLPDPSNGLYIRREYTEMIRENRYDLLIIGLTGADDNREILRYARTAIHEGQHKGDIVTLTREDKVRVWPTSQFEDGTPIVIYYTAYAGASRIAHSLLYLLSEMLGWNYQYYSPLVDNGFYTARKRKEGKKITDEEIAECTYHHLQNVDYRTIVHLHDEVRINRIADSGVKTLFLMRDLRDMYNSRLQRDCILEQVSPEERHAKAVQAFKGYPYEIGTYYSKHPSLRFIAENFLEATKAPNCHIMRFEDMHKDMHRTLIDILTWAGVYRNPFINFDEQALKEAVYRSSFEYQTGARSRGQRPSAPDAPGEKQNTCRKGIVGDWKSWFTSETVEVFKEIAGEALIELGYEKDMNWNL